MTSSVVFIDSRVSNVQSLVAGIAAGTEVVYLSAAGDGVAQMAAYLDGRTDIGSIQLVSHGRAGALYLGDAVLDEESLARHADDLARIGRSLGADGDFLLYGCNVAQGDVGAAFISQLAAATGADVAASTDLTGGAAQGGDWVLEASTGSIEATTPFSAAATADFNGTLAGQLNGQLWFTVQGGTSDVIDGRINSDGSNRTTVHLNPAVTSPGDYDVGGTDLSIGIDLPAGYYFVVNSDGMSISSHKVSDGSLVDTIQVANLADFELINALEVDPINEFIYVGRYGVDLGHSGVVRLAYNPTTGNIDPSNAYTFAATPFVTGGLEDVRYLDLQGNFLYVTDNDNGYVTSPFVSTNGIYRIDITSPGSAPVLLTTAAQFPAQTDPSDDTRAMIGSLAVNTADSQIYFTTHQYTAGGAHGTFDALWRMPIAGGTATNMNVNTAVANALHYAGEWGGLTFDKQTRQLYISDQEDPTSSSDRHIIQLQLNGTGTAFVGSPVVNTYTVVGSPGTELEFAL